MKKTVFGIAMFIYLHQISDKAVDHLVAAQMDPVHDTGIHNPEWTSSQIDIIPIGHNLK